MTTATWEFKDLIGLAVVANAEAREVGNVEQVLFDPSANALYGLVITPVEEGSAPLLLRLKGIRTIGKDAVTIESMSAIEPLSGSPRAQEIAEAGGYREGMDVMTESGESVGKVDKVTLKDDGTVASYHSTSGFFGSKHDIEPSEVKSGSGDMIIILDSAREGAAKNVAG
jgi:uncharacterized protein YrrD